MALTKQKACLWECLSEALRSAATRLLTPPHSITEVITDGTNQTKGMPGDIAARRERTLSSGYALLLGCIISFFIL